MAEVELSLKRQEEKGEKKACRNYYRRSDRKLPQKTKKKNKLRRPSSDKRRGEEKNNFNQFFITNCHNGVTSDRDRLALFSQLFSRRQISCILQILTEPTELIASMRLINRLIKTLQQPASTSFSFFCAI